jgi:FAS-associated factor 2
LTIQPTHRHSTLTNQLQIHHQPRPSWIRLLTLLLRIILYPLQQIARLIFPPDELDGLSPQVTAKAAQAFSSYLRSLIPTLQENVWADVGFAQLKHDALLSNRLVLIYLHSPLHRDANTVARNLLCHETVLPILQQYSCLGVSIHTAQGAQLAQLLQAASFPMIAVLQASRGSSLSLILKLQGPTLTNLPHHQLIAYLHTTLQRHQMAMAEQEARQIQREQETMLRREQDDEYQEALRADQERMRLAQQERAMAQRQQEEAEAAARRIVEEKSLRMQQARGLLRPAPVAGGANLRFVLSSGKKIERRFYCDETIGTLRAFLTVHFADNSMPDIASIGLSTTYPRKTYNEEDDNHRTLQEVGLAPQAVIMVQDLDA